MSKEANMRSVDTNGEYLIDGNVKEKEIGPEISLWMLRELFADFSKEYDQIISGGRREVLNIFFDKMTSSIGYKLESIANSNVHMRKALHKMREIIDLNQKTTRKLKKTFKKL